MTTLLATVKNPVIDPSLGLHPGIGGGVFGPSTLGIVLRGLISIGFIIGGVIAFFMLIRGSYMYITSGGDKDQAQKAARALTQAIVGLIILLSVFAILATVNIVFGFNLLQFNFPTLTT